MVNSRRKGKEAEQEWCAKLGQHGFEARRAQQYRGTRDSADVLCTELDEILEFHAEVKRVEALNITATMRKAVEDAGGKRPYVAHRRNRGEWLVTMRADDLLPILRRYIDVGAEEWP